MGSTQCIPALCDTGIEFRDRICEGLARYADVTREQLQTVSFAENLSGIERCCHLLARRVINDRRRLLEDGVVENDPVPQFRLIKQRVFANINAGFVFPHEASPVGIHIDLPGVAAIQDRYSPGQ